MVSGRIVNKGYGKALYVEAVGSCNSVTSKNYVGDMEVGEIAGFILELPCKPPYIELSYCDSYGNEHKMQLSISEAIAAGETKKEEVEVFAREWVTKECVTRAVISSSISIVALALLVVFKRRAGVRKEE